MQTLEVISVNIWNIVISLINLLLLFLIVKKFLFKPVNKMLSNRQKELDSRYNDADEAKRIAEENREFWEEKISTVKDEADALIKDAQDSAKRQSDAAVLKAKEKADQIISQAKNEAEYEKKKAEEEIKKEIIEVSTALANKLLKREINTKDHHELIDSYIQEIGEENE